MHQPYDRALKQIAARAALGLLELADVLPPDSGVTLRPLEREVAGPALRTDQLFAYTAEGMEWIAHFEFESRWSAAMPGRVLRYQAVIKLEYPVCEVNSVVFVLRPAGCPESAIYGHREGKISPVTGIRYRVVRIWQLDAAKVLSGGDPALLPMAMLMNTTEDQVREIAARVSGDREAAGQFQALAALRYDKDQIEKILGGNPMFMKALLKESWAVQEVMEESRVEGQAAGRLEGQAAGRLEGQAAGRLEGQAAGQAAGRTDEARALLRRSLAARFPGLDTLPELDLITDARVLEDLLLEHVVGASTREAALEAIQAAVR